ncbi:T6SS phospholipase effector Tle1-like catalytic domain-containing protein [Janthinobacterium agaricidamnosum]|nr:DUF2235 domain-containing protein [Janthinobacterium agaricidamnosum]
MNAEQIQFANIPELFKTRSVDRPLNSREIMQRAKAISTNNYKPRELKCTGQIFIGIFFDGTGNNEDIDYLQVKNLPAKQKHSNVVRLFHAYPDHLMRGTSKYYRYYIPGVGTNFPEIGDNGGMLGTGASWNGEPRLIWGLTRIFNAISDYVYGDVLISTEKSGNIANNTGGIGSIAFHREHVFKSYWAGELKKRISRRTDGRPAPEQINLSIYGFSRGAAEARAFVNWLYAICDEKDDAYTFCDIPLRIEFLGIFDTVASVGIAGGFSNGLLGSEGHQSWASNNMQVHRGVESCLHIVAAHEVRATFPLDSVRVDGVYPNNVKEYVYPGAHSDIGGGYSIDAQGKTDALARIPGFEMYCAALIAGSPFFNLKELAKKFVNALVPTQATIDIFKNYCSVAAVQPGPVETMMQQHMGHYFNYRYHARHDPVNNPKVTSYIKRQFYKKAIAEQEFLRDTQQHFIAILAGVATDLEKIMANEKSYDQYVSQPFVSTGSYIPSIAIVKYGLKATPRISVLRDVLDNGDRDRLAHGLPEKLKKWRKWLPQNLSPELSDADAPERDVLKVVATLSDEPQPPEVVEFFDHWVHDSIAGLAKDKVNEFLLNGIGIAKFRRVYFGDRGDAMLRDAAAQLNKERMAAIESKRKILRQQHLEAAEYQRTRPTW